MTSTAPGFRARATALLAVLLLLFPSVGEAMGHGCPHHGAVHADAQAAPGSHEGHHAAGHGAGREAPAPEEHAGPCTCAGMCQAGTLPGLPAGPTRLLPTAPAAAPCAPALEAQARPRFPTHFLPYGQAPPTGR